MKNIHILMLTLLFTSCNDNVTIPKEEYKKLIGDTLRSKYPRSFKLYTEGLDQYADGIVMGSDNHEYLVWSYNTTACNVEHYIDCKLCRGSESVSSLIK